MEAAATRLGFQRLAYGMNLDDRGDFRPGQKAAALHGVHAPLVDAGLTKADIRALAREAGLAVWDKPAAPCLSSRVAYGLPVTPRVLSAVEQAEDYLAGLGFRPIPCAAPRRHRADRNRARGNGRGPFPAAARGNFRAAQGHRLPPRRARVRRDAVGLAQPRLAERSSRRAGGVRSGRMADFRSTFFNRKT